VTIEGMRDSLIFAGLVVTIMSQLCARVAAAGELSRGVRRPVGLVLDESQRVLFVANGRSGTVSVVGTETLEVEREAAVAGRLADLRRLPGRAVCVAIDDAAHELIVLRMRADDVAVVGRVAVSPFPMRVAVHRDGTTCAVASLWSHTESVIKVAGDGVPRVEYARALPFAPREVLFLPDQRRLVVADAFRGRLAVLAADDGTIESVRDFPGHNIRGLAVSADGKDVYVSCQKLNPLARADFDDLHWGTLLANGLRIVPAAALVDGVGARVADLTTAAPFERLGRVSDAAGDPGPIEVDERGRMAVALSGVAQVAFGAGPRDLGRVDVGLHPVAMAAEPSGHRLFVVNQHDDTVSVVDLKQAVVLRTIALGPEAELTPADRGEQLFYNARLSHDRWMSCHSCHSDGHTADLVVDTLGDGDYGAPKRVPTLLGVADTAPYAWNGGLATLEEQVAKSVQTTMHGVPLSDAQRGDLAAYLRTLGSSPADGSRVRAADEALVEQGRALFEAQRCSRCHTPPAYTSAHAYDVGLADEHGRREFNPPSLRGVGQRTAFFHDGRAKRLEDVFSVHGHQVAEALSEREVEALGAFLGSL
jgi:YVTN family beta-propeller protein